MEQPDTLIKAMQEGDEGAFSRIYTMYSEALNGVIFSIVQDEAIAEEVLQDVFVKIWNKSSTYTIGKGRFFTWILNIARNSAIDRTRSKSFKNAQKNLSTTNFVDILTSGDNLNTKVNAIGIRKFVEALKPACIKIIDLLFFKGYTHADAAETLKIPLGTLKTRNRNCIKDLRKLILG